MWIIMWFLWCVIFPLLVWPSSSIAHLSGSSSLRRPGRPCRWLLRPLRWGSCRAPGRAPQPSWRWRWRPSALALASRGLSRSGTWSLPWWWGPRWSPAPWGSAWNTCRSPSWRSGRRRRSLWRKRKLSFCSKEVDPFTSYLHHFFQYCLRMTTVCVERFYFWPLNVLGTPSCLQAM